MLSGREGKRRPYVALGQRHMLHPPGSVAITGRHAPCLRCRVEYGILYDYLLVCVLLDSNGLGSSPGPSGDIKYFCPVGECFCPRRGDR